MAVLIRRGQHMSPLLAVCKRYGVGVADKYDRGLWIEKKDLAMIAEKMEADSTAIRGSFKGRPWLVVQGTNRHNQVALKDFEALF